MNKLTSNDVGLIVALLRLNARFVRVGKSAPDRNANGKIPDDFGGIDPKILSASCKRSLATVYRSISHLKELGILEVDSDGDVWTVRLPSPENEPPVRRIDAEPIEKMWASNLDFKSALALTIRWLYRRSHSADASDNFEETKPSTALIARACRISRRSFYGDRINDKIVEEGWVKKEEPLKGGVVPMSIRTIDSDTNIERMTDEILDAVDVKRKDAGQKPIERLPPIRELAMKAAIFLESLGDKHLTGTYFVDWVDQNVTRPSPYRCVNIGQVAADDTAKLFIEDLKAAKKRSKERKPEGETGKILVVDFRLKRRIG